MLRPKKQVEAESETSTGERPVRYPVVEARVYQGTQALDADDVKEFLGWEEEPEGGDWGKDFLLKDRYGKKVRLNNNPDNRPFAVVLAEVNAQEHLRRRWRLNGEAAIVGRTGKTLSCQHRFAGLVLAAQDWERHPDRYREAWPDGPPTMETVITFGVSEDDETVNTIDTGRPRTLSDVLYRSVYFADMTGKARETAAKVADKAVRRVWWRTGVEDALDLTRTHSESMAFLAAHPRLVEAVKHVTEEYGRDWKANCQGLIGPGYAAGLLYLMAASDDGGAGYPEVRHESVLKLAAWDRAADFWTLLSGNSPDLRPVRFALAALPDQGYTLARAGVLIKAWNVFKTGRDPNAADLTLKFKQDQETLTHHLLEWPTVGGIDSGEPDHTKRDEAKVDDKPPPGPAELQQRKETVRKEPPKAKRRAEGETEVDTYLIPLRAAHPDRVLFFLPPKSENGSGSIHCWDGDAEAVAEVVGIEVGKKAGHGHLSFPAHHKAFKAIMVAGKDYPVAYCHPDPAAEHGYRVELFTPVPPKMPTPRKPKKTKS